MNRSYKSFCLLREQKKLEILKVQVNGLLPKGEGGETQSIRRNPPTISRKIGITCWTWRPVEMHRANSPLQISDKFAWLEHASSSQ